MHDSFQHFPDPLLGHLILLLLFTLSSTSPSFIQTKHFLSDEVVSCSFWVMGNWLWQSSDISVQEERGFTLTYEIYTGVYVLKHCQKSTFFDSWHVQNVQQHVLLDYCSLIVFLFYMKQGNSFHSWLFDDVDELLNSVTTQESKRTGRMVFLPESQTILLNNLGLRGSNRRRVDLWSGLTSSIHLCRHAWPGHRMIFWPWCRFMTSLHLLTSFLLFIFALKEYHLSDVHNIQISSISDPLQCSWMPLITNTVMDDLQ